MRYRLPIALIVVIALLGLSLDRVLAGGTTTITATGSSGGIGNASGIVYWDAQSFLVYPGIASQFTFTLVANTGSPTGGLTWGLYSDTNSSPGTILASGTIASPTVSATNTVNITGGPSLSASTIYWLVLHTTAAQSSGNYYQWRRSAVSVYADGNGAYSTDSGSSWSSLGIDYDMSITTIDPPTDTPTVTNTPTFTYTPSNTFTPTFTYTPSNTPTGTLPPSNTPTETFTPTRTLTYTPTYTYTPSATNTPYPTWTATNTPNLFVITTLTTGQEVAVEYLLTAGDMLNGSLQLIIIGLLGFILFLLTLRRRTD